MRKLFVTALVFLSMTSISQSNHLGCGFNLVLIAERDSTGKLITYYAHSGKNIPIEESVYVEEIKIEGKEEEIIINFL